MAHPATEFYDALRSLPQGMNSGDDPLDLPRDQAAFLTNATVRGKFARPRSAYRRIPITLDASVVVDALNALWQGGTYYKPDSGTESLMAAIGGRLLQFQVSSNAATVFDRSIAGDLNSTSAPQSWLWQSDSWLIVQDGFRLPLFFDGNTTRRSLGASVQLNTLAGGGFTAPAIGASVSATLTTAFTGPYNTPILIATSSTSQDRFLFSVALGSSGYSVTLRNNSGVAGATLAADTTVIYSKPSLVGYVSGTQTKHFTGSFTLGGGGSYDLLLSSPTTIAIGTIVTIATRNYKVTNVTNGGKTITIVLNFGAPVSIDITWTDSDVVTISGNTQPNVIVGTLSQAFTVPAIAGSSTAYLTGQYTGSVPATVWIGTAQYTITAVAASAGSATVTLINNNATAGTTFQAGGQVYNTAELPAGRMGAYGLGRNWMSLVDGKQFIAGDIVGSSSGSVGYSYRDSVLHVTENARLAGGGNFSVPSGEIRAMTFTATLDASLGQGPLAVLTPDVVFSCQAPVDRTTWQNITNPILTASLISNGGLGQYSTVIANGDVIFRSLEGLRSLIFGRRDFNSWGNVPISAEVQSILDADDQSLLPFASAIVFDNRMLMTCTPTQTGLGVYHTGLIALNFDPISSLRGKAPSVYDGLWTGLNVLQLVKGKFAGVERAFAFCLSENLDTIELFEILPSDGPNSLLTDDGTEITWEFTSAAVNFGQNDPRTRQMLNLSDGEIFVDRIAGPVTFQAYFKPDQWPEWVPWYSWTEIFDANSDPGFRPRMGLGKPETKAADDTNDRPLTCGYTYQFKLVVTGYCRFLGARFKAVVAPQAPFARPNATGQSA